jgi:hypothetical protein
VTSGFESARRRFAEAAAKLGDMAAMEEVARWDRLDAERLMAAAAKAQAAAQIEALTTSAAVPGPPSPPEPPRKRNRNAAAGTSCAFKAMVTLLLREGLLGGGPQAIADRIEVGYGYFSPTGPDLRVVPEGQPLPPQPADKDDKGRRMFRPVFRVKLFGKILDGLREWSSSANVVLEAVDDLYQKFRAAPEAQGGKIPIVELTKTIPLTLGKGQRQTTVYTPCFVIVGWTDRVEAMGARTVSVPKAPTVVADVMQAAVTVATPPPPNWNGGGGSLEDDSIPFGVCWQ